MRVERVAVQVGTRSPTGTVAAYLLDETDGVLVDPCARTDALDTAVERADPAHLCCTHHHPDHVGAVAAYAEDRTVWARTGRAAAFEAATGVTPDRTFSPGTTLPTGDGTIEIVDTPGHAPEHVALETPHGIVAGDLAVAEGSVVVGAPEGDMRAYLSSLRRVYARDPERLYPGHGPVIEEPRPTLVRLLEHRLDRERRVLAAVESGAETPDSILDVAYQKDLTGVRDLAQATVLAHLEKLAVEGHLTWDGERAHV